MVRNARRCRSAFRGCRAGFPGRGCGVPTFQLADFVTDLSEDCADRWGISLSGRPARSDLRDDPGGSERDDQTELTEDSANRVDAGGARGEPSGADPVYGGQALLFDGLDGDRADFLVPGGFQQGLGVDRVGLVARPVTRYMTDRQEPNLVPQASQLSSPVWAEPQASSTRHWRLFAHELEQLAAGQPALLLT